MGTTGNYQSLISRIDGFIRKYYLNKIVRGSIYLAAALFASYVTVTLAEYYGNFSTTVRTVLFWAFIALNVFIFVRWIALPLFSYLKLGKTITHDQASEIIGRHFSNVKDKLLNTLQLKKLADVSPEQRGLIEASIDQKIAELSPVPFTSAIRISQNRQYLKYAAVPFVVILVIAFTNASILSEGTNRLINHDRKFEKKAPFRFVILNDHLTAVQGQDFKLDVKLAGNEIPKDVYVEDGVNTFRLDKENIVTFSFTFKNVQQTHKIRLVGGEFSSEEYTLVVKKRPSLVNADAYLEYPAYLDKPNEQITNAGDLVIPEGTRILWKFRTQNADRLHMGIGSQVLDLKADPENEFHYAYRAKAPTTYSVLPVNAEVATSDSVFYKLDVVPDLGPSIEVNQQADSVNNRLLYFVGQVNDDHGFSRLTFNYKTVNAANAGKVRSMPVTFDKQSLQSNFFYAWNANDVKVGPGDEIEYYFEVFDNDGVNGPKSTRSAIKSFRMPTQEEAQKSIEATSESVKNQTEEAIRKARQIERDAKKINENLLDKKSLSFEERKQIEQLMQKQADLENLVKNIQKQNQQNNFDRQNLNQEQRKDILEKQKQIEDLFNNVLDEKTKEILRNIQKLLEQNNKPQTQQELNKMQMDSKSLQKELDRILDLYKQLEFDQKMTQTIDQLKEQAKEQQKLADQSKKNDPSANDKTADQKKQDAKNADQKTKDQQRADNKQNAKDQQDTKSQPNDAQQKLTPDDIKQKQDELNKAFDDIKEALKDLEKKKDELAEQNNFQNPEKQQNAIQQQQQQSSKNLENKNMKKAAENQENAAEQMEKMAEQMEQMQQQSEEQQNEVNMDNLRDILDKLVNSSFDQEKVMQTLKSTRTNDPAYVSLGQKQKDILDNLKAVQDSLYELSKKVPQIQSVVNKEIRDINVNINAAIGYLGDRRTSDAGVAQQYAMTSINNLALMLSEAQEQMQNASKRMKPGNGKGRPSLQQLSRMQQQLNQNMQKAREQMQREGQQPGRQPGQRAGQQGQQGQNGQNGQGNRGQMSEQLARMAREQQLIRQALQDINREQNKDGKKGLGDLDQLAKDMEQSETDLVNKKIQQETLLRQQDILTKLLDAEKSERERDEDQKRESKEGKDMTPDYKIVLDQYKRIKQRETELLKTVPPALNSFYKIKVGDYFKSLNSGK